MPSVSIDSTRGREGNVGLTELALRVSLSASSSASVSVAFETVGWPGGTAGASDYHAMSGTVAFAPGETTQTIVIHAVGDTRDEANEIFFVHLSSPTNATVASHHGTVTIVDDDRPCTVMGTPGADTLVGTAGRDVICGLGGNDIIRGRGGTDVLVGAGGADRLDGGAGQDRLLGGAGADTLLARDRTRDVVDGGAGTDRARVDGSDSVRRVERRF